MPWIAKSQTQLKQLSRHTHSLLTVLCHLLFSFDPSLAQVFPSSSSHAHLCYQESSDMNLLLYQNAIPSPCLPALTGLLKTWPLTTLITPLSAWPLSVTPTPQHMPSAWKFCIFSDLLTSQEAASPSFLQLIVLSQV